MLRRCLLSGTMQMDGAISGLASWQAERRRAEAKASDATGAEAKADGGTGTGPDGCGGDADAQVDDPHGIMAVRATLGAASWAVRGDLLLCARSHWTTIPNWRVSEQCVRPWKLSIVQVAR